MRLRRAQQCFDDSKTLNVASSILRFFHSVGAVCFSVAQAFMPGLLIDEETAPFRASFCSPQCGLQKLAQRNRGNGKC